MHVQEINHHGHIFKYADHPLTIPASATRSMLELIEKWQQTFPEENTFVQRKYSIPSLYIRFDCVIDAQGQMHTYEIESGCVWVGYAGIVNTAFREKRDQLVRDVWPPFKLLIHDSMAPNDDALWIEPITLTEALCSTGPLQIRYPQRWFQQSQRNILFPRLIRSVQFHFDKQYGTQLGLWKMVGWEKTQKGTLLPWNESFVLKPVDGHGGQDIMVWNYENRDGRATRTQVLASLQENKIMCLQKFIPPMHLELDGISYNVILRPFFGFDTNKRKWVPMHGVWVGRPYPNMRIHGAADAISGPLYMES